MVHVVGDAMVGMQYFGSSFPFFLAQAVAITIEDMMIGLAVLLVPACFAMMIPDLLVFRVATALVISLGLCATNQIFALAGEVVGKSEIGPVMGVVGLGGGLFGYVGPQVLGLLRDRTGGFTAGWYFVAGGVVLSLIEIVFLRHYTRSRN